MYIKWKVYDSYDNSLSASWVCQFIWCQTGHENMSLSSQLPQTHDSCITLDNAIAELYFVRTENDSYPNHGIVASLWRDDKWHSAILWYLHYWGTEEINILAGTRQTGYHIITLLILYILIFYRLLEWFPQHEIKQLSSQITIIFTNNLIRQSTSDK